jgi:hypothetical protein
MKRFWKMRVLLAAALAWTATETTTFAGLFKRTACDDCNPCVNPCVPATPQMVTRTIYVPEYTTEKRVVRETVCKPVQKERVVTVMQCVPETKMVEQAYTAIEKRQQTRTVRYTVQKPVFETQTRQIQVQVPVWETKQVDYQVSVPVRREVEKTFVVNVPYQEQRQGTKTVCRMVPVKEMRTVTCDNGRWETQSCEVPCNSCSGRRGWFRGGCEDDCCGTVTVCQRVWVPQLETKQVEVTTYRREMEEVPYTYSVVVCKPETRTKMVTVCDYETQTRTRDVRTCSYRTETRSKDYRVCHWVTQEKARDVVDTYCVPVTKTRTVPVTTYKNVPREKTVRYTDYVSEVVEREVEVPVCRMVAKTITVPANECYDDYADCGGRRWLRNCR